MRSNILILTWICLSLILILSCGKEQSVQAIISKGTLRADTTGACLLSVVNGVYHKDSLLTVANFINAQVNISVTGKYSIQSDTVNGFSFRGEGYADSAGLRTVHLRAIGTPAAAGTYMFHLRYGPGNCAIGVSVINPILQADSAQYTLTTAQGGCPPASFKGVYKTGVALDTSNFMEFDVRVTKAGPYAFNLAPVNGISFTGAGIFATTGTEHITLKGSGTPLAAGNFTIGVRNCTYALSILPDTTANAAYTINCASATIVGTYTEGAVVTAQNTVKISATVTAPGKYTISTPAVNGLTFSASGTFTVASTTPQTITLLASGTPTARGTFDHTITAGGNTCTFKVTCIAPAGQAVFTLNGAPDACPSPVIAGNYVAGTALSAANTVMIKTVVATAGAYSITTNTVNGIKFAASGNFAATGQQTITLTGTGTPVAAGVTTLTPQMGSSSCKFTVTIAASPVTAGIFTCKIDGVFTAFNDRASFTHDKDQLVGQYTLALQGYTDSANASGSTVTKMQLFINNNDGSQVKAGSYNVDGILLPKGYMIAVNYTLVNPDQSVVIWTTGSTIIPPPNPAFTIVVSSVTATRVTGTFTGKVTNLSQGGTQLKTITEGVFDLPLQ